MQVAIHLPGDVVEMQTGAGGEYGPVERDGLAPGGDAGVERWR